MCERLVSRKEEPKEQKRKGDLRDFAPLRQVYNLIQIEPRRHCDTESHCVPPCLQCLRGSSYTKETLTGH